MFEHTILDKWPWEKGIAPDVTGENIEIYLEKRYTDMLRKDLITGKKLRRMKNYYVALCRFIEPEKLDWVIFNDKDVVYGTTNLDALLAHIEKSKNGKRYVRMTISEMREADRYGNSHTVFVEERKQEKRDVVNPENFVDDIPW